MSEQATKYAGTSGHMHVCMYVCTYIYKRFLFVLTPIWLNYSSCNYILYSSTVARDLEVLGAHCSFTEVSAESRDLPISGLHF